MTLTEDFLQGLKEIESCPPLLLFEQHSFIQKGYAYFVTYKRKELSIEFIFGPSDWQVEVLVQTSKGKFAFKDLLANTAILNWVNENRYFPKSDRSVKNEMLWFVELLKFSLPLIE